MAASDAPLETSSEQEERPLVLVLDVSVLQDALLRAGDHDRDQDEEGPGADVPRDQQPRRLAQAPGREQIGDDHQARADQQARTMGEAPEDAPRRLLGPGRRRVGHAEPLGNGK